MRFLVTNDDGILARGIECLVAAAEPLGDVTVVAPDREQSATSHSLTLHHPVRPVRRGERRWQVDGTPTDCVMLALEALMPQRPDFVLSGINHGQNMGEDVLYSGTVAAAMEGLALVDLKGNWAWMELTFGDYACGQALLGEAQHLYENLGLFLIDSGKMRTLFDYMAKAVPRPGQSSGGCQS